MVYAIAAVAAMIIDQAVKYWTTAHVVLNSGQHKLIPGFIHLANVHNTGAAFSFMEGGRWFFVVLCLVFVGALIYLLARGTIRGRAARWMAVMVMAGALGNCIDRIISGYVVDMFEFDFLIFGHRFPVFNVADILITIGGIAFCVCVLLEKPDEIKKGQFKRAPASGGVGRAAVNPHRSVPPQGKGRITPFPGSAARQTRPGPAGTGSDNPFAEWERQPAQKNPGVSDAPGGSTFLNMDVSSADASPDGPASHVRPAREPEQPGAPEPRPKRPSASGGDGFDLEDILAEFRDQCWISGFLPWRRQESA